MAGFFWSAQGWGLHVLTLQFLARTWLGVVRSAAHGALAVQYGHRRSSPCTCPMGLGVSLYAVRVLGRAGGVSLLKSWQCCGWGAQGAVLPVCGFGIAATSSISSAVGGAADGGRLVRMPIFWQALVFCFVFDPLSISAVWGAEGARLWSHVALACASYLAQRPVSTWCGLTCAAEGVLGSAFSDCLSGQPAALQLGFQWLPCAAIGLDADELTSPLLSR